MVTNGREDTSRYRRIEQTADEAAEAVKQIQFWVKLGIALVFAVAAATAAAVTYAGGLAKSKDVVAQNARLVTVENKAAESEAAQARLDATQTRLEEKVDHVLEVLADVATATHAKRR